jgi:hypothetical protein
MSTKFSALKADTPAIETDALTRQFEAAVVVDRQADASNEAEKRQTAWPKRRVGL